jgi:hypothetical protein
MPPRSTEKQVPPRGCRVGAGAACLFTAALAAGLAASRPARAQSLHTRLQNEFGDFIRQVTALTGRSGIKSGSELIDFLSHIEILNLEKEIDRLVGSPWQLSDSTTYKLSLAPIHLGYPVYDRMISQMTRLDDIRTRRIQTLTVDSVQLIVVDLDALTAHQDGRRIADAFLHYFNGREAIDMGVFLLAQQAFFPQTPAEWDEFKHRLARHEALVAIGAIGVGAVLGAGALSNSGTLLRCRDDRCGLGWYGGFSGLGYTLQPTLRGGLTARVPKLELSVGWLQNVRADAGDTGSVLEMAVREGWLGRYTNAAGWDSFFEGALRRVVVAEGGYRGEWLTARGGLFLKRQLPSRLRFYTVRGSTEVESDLTGSLRYAAGLGIDHARSGLSAVLQSSRTDVARDGVSLSETRTALLIAGTLEPPDYYFRRSMQILGRELREAWNQLVASEAARRQAESELRVLAAATPDGRFEEVVASVREASAESEEHRLRVATLLGDYLEARRLFYAIKHWQRGSDEDYGPVDGELLMSAATSVFARLSELVYFLQGAEVNLARLRDRYTRIADRLSSPEAGAVGTELARRDLEKTDREWRGASVSVVQALRLYESYLSGIRRIESLAGGLLQVRYFEPLDVRTMRKLLTLVAQPML